MNLDPKELEATGVSIPSGQVARTAQWVTLLSDTERHIDMVATEYLTSRLARVPADSTLRDPLARHWARRAVSSARVAVAAWEDHADALTARHERAALENGIPPESSTHTAPLPAQVVAASVDPMGLHRWSLALEHAGTAWLHAFGLPATRPDVLPKGKFRHVCSSDRVAYRGVDRFEPAQPCRYGKSGHLPAVEFALPLVAGWTLAEYLTKDMSAVSAVWHPATLEERDELGRLIGRRVEWSRVALPDNGTRVGWRGLRRITWENAPRARGIDRKREARRGAARRERASVTTATRGPAVGPWSMSDRSLPAAVTRLNLGDMVALLDATLRAAQGQIFNLGTVEVSVIGPAEVRANDRTYPIREVARRAALAYAIA